MTDVGMPTLHACVVKACCKNGEGGFLSLLALMSVGSTADMLLRREVNLRQNKAHQPGGGDIAREGTIPRRESVCTGPQGTARLSIYLGMPGTPALGAWC